MGLHKKPYTKKTYYFSSHASTNQTQNSALVVKIITLHQNGPKGHIDDHTNIYIKKWEDSTK